jgi:hypothetical protein
MRCAVLAERRDGERWVRAAIDRGAPPPQPCSVSTVAWSTSVITAISCRSDDADARARQGAHGRPDMAGPVRASLPSWSRCPGRRNPPPRVRRGGCRSTPRCRARPGIPAARHSRSMRQRKSRNGPSVGRVVPLRVRYQKLWRRSTTARTIRRPPGALPVRRQQQMRVGTPPSSQVSGASHSSALPRAPRCSTRAPPPLHLRVTTCAPTCVRHKRSNSAANNGTTGVCILLTDVARTSVGMPARIYPHPCAAHYMSAQAHEMVGMQGGHGMALPAGRSTGWLAARKARLGACQGGSTPAWQ